MKNLTSKELAWMRQWAKDRYGRLSLFPAPSVQWDFLVVESQSEANSSEVRQILEENKLSFERFAEKYLRFWASIGLDTKDRDVQTLLFSGCVGDMFGWLLSLIINRINRPAHGQETARRLQIAHQYLDLLVDFPHFAKSELEASASAGNHAAYDRFRAQEFEDIMFLAHNVASHKGTEPKHEYVRLVEIHLRGAEEGLKTLADVHEGVHTKVDTLLPVVNQ